MQLVMLGSMDPLVLFEILGSLEGFATNGAGVRFEGSVDCVSAKRI